MTDLEDLTEDDISDLSDEDLERFVAEWLNVGFVECRECDGRGYQYKGRFAPDCWKCGGTGDHRPKYTSDPAAAWRLLEQMPRNTYRIGFDGNALRLQRVDPGSGQCLEEGVIESEWKRAATEAAAILRIRDVEPRKLDG